MPPGLSPVDAGRLGLWLLSRRSHQAAKRRRAFPSHEWHTSFAGRWARLITPWRVFEYPGASMMLAHLCEVKRETARGWIYGKRLPARHALRLAVHLEQHASACEALAHELRAYAGARDRKFSNGRG